LSRGVGLAGVFEVYLMPRLSVRGQIGTAWLDLEPLQGLVGSVHPIFVIGNVVYNWEASTAVRPYVTAGGGFYRYAIERVVSSRSTVDVDDDHSGVHFGGGLEYFFTRRATMTLELLYHKVGDLGSPLAFTNTDGTFWSFNVGAKQYF